MEIIDKIHYRQAEDQFGINQIQFVLPKQAVEGVQKKSITWSIVVIWDVERHIRP